MAMTAARPSDARRAALRGADRSSSGRSAPHISNLFPIERYYEAAEKVRVLFEEAYEDHRLDDAYILGKRFASFCVDALPTHNYYASPSPKYLSLRRKNERHMSDVVVKLEKVVKWMDKEEIIRQEMERKEREKREREREERQRQYKLHVEQSALSKLEQLNTLFPPSLQEEEGRQQPPQLEGFPDASKSESLLPPLGPPPTDGSSSFFHASMPINMDDIAPLPPPPPPPPPAFLVPPPLFPEPTNSSSSVGGEQASVPSAPPSYDAIMGNFPEPQGNSAPIVEQGTPVFPPSAIEDFFSAPSAATTNNQSTPKPPVSNLPIKKLRNKVTSEYLQLKEKRMIDVFALGTYQGKRASTNGCTVISPLVVSNHLNKTVSSISDDTINHVIDTQAPPILREIRRKLGLPNDALIIPSDVHDYMVDHKILFQDQFVGVCGGNIVDPNHLGEFVKLLSTPHETANDKKKKKMGAALFFHEHVVSIVKIPLSSSSGSGGDYWYDLVDSMPTTTDPKTKRSVASRTRCKSHEILETCLYWYACRKFSESDCNYIDRNPWDDAMCDFDPRVFQGFVWSEV